MVCGHPVQGRRQACSGKCRIALWRRTHEQAHTAEVAQLRSAVARAAMGRGRSAAEGDP